MKKYFTKIAGIALAAVLMAGTMGITSANVQAATATTQFSDVESTRWKRQRHYEGRFQRLCRWIHERYI